MLSPDDGSMNISEKNNWTPSLMNKISSANIDD
jgi:hypothetical protein